MICAVAIRRRMLYFSFEVHVNINFQETNNDLDSKLSPSKVTIVGTAG